MFRLCVTIFILLNVVLLEADDSAFTSPVLRKNKTNVLTFAGKTYYFGTIFKANFFRSLQFCRQQGMQLLSVNSQAENDRIGKYVEEIGSQWGHFWTSGTNLADTNQWIWLSTGNNFIYTNWHPGEPTYKSSSNVTESCVEARHFGKGFTWNDLDCNGELYFICESSEACRR